MECRDSESIRCRNFSFGQLSNLLDLCVQGQVTRRPVAAVRSGGGAAAACPCPGALRGVSTHRGPHGCRADHGLPERCRVVRRLPPRLILSVLAAASPLRQPRCIAALRSDHREESQGKMGGAAVASLHLQADNMPTASRPSGGTRGEGHPGCLPRAQGA